MEDNQLTTEAKPRATRVSGAEMTGGRKAGFRADGTAYPGVDPVTGARRSVTYEGLREEFGEAKGTRLYNLIAAAAFGGVLPHRPALSLASMADEYARQDIDEASAERRRKRRAKVEELLAMAEREA